MARRTRLALLSLGLLLAAVLSVTAAEPSVQDLFARARRALREQPALDSEAESPSTLTGVAPNSPAPRFPALLALPAAPTGHNDPPRAPPAPRFPALLALPAAPTGHHDPPRAPPAPPTSQRRALPSGRTIAPTCTFVTYIGGGGTEVTEVVRGGDGRVFVVGPGSTWDKTLAAASHQAPPTDSDDSSSEEEEEEEDEDGAVFSAVMDNFCQAFAYARAFQAVIDWFI